MTATFRFNDKCKTLDIEGHTFEIVIGDIEALSAGQELAQRLGETDLETLGPEAYRTLADDIKAAVDQVLGEGSCTKILADRRATVTGLVQLLMFVLREATDDFAAAVDVMVAEFTETVPED